MEDVRPSNQRFFRAGERGDARSLHRHASLCARLIRGRGRRQERPLEVGQGARLQEVLSDLGQVPPLRPPATPQCPKTKKKKKKEKQMENRN